MIPTMLESSVSRRGMLIRCALLLLPSVGEAATQLSMASVTGRLRELETSRGVRIGLAACDTGTTRRLLYRAQERFLFCSTWKFLLVAALLAEVDSGRQDLQRQVHFGKADLVPHAPVTELHLDGGMTLAELCAAALIVSDNTASNLLLTALGGFDKFNAFVRSLGDEATILNRNEPGLNVLDGTKDTTTPLAMMGDLRSILLGNVLKASSRQKLLDWMIACTTGRQMLRAGLPATWTVGDKTGHGDNANNDIAIVTPPGRKPLLVAVYTSYPPGVAALSDLVQQIGQIVAETFA